MAQPGERHGADEIVADSNGPGLLPDMDEVTTMDIPTLPAAEVLGQQLRFSSIDGEVMSVDRVTNTHVGSTSGSVVAFGNVVTVSAPTLSVIYETSKRIWVRREDGSEVSVAAPDTLEVRASHRVTVLLASGRQRNQDVYRWCAIVNHATRRWDQVDDYPPVNILNGWMAFWVGIANQGGTSPLFGVILMIWIGLFFGSTMLFQQASMDMFLISGVAAGVVGFGSLIAATHRVDDAKAGYAKVVRQAVEAASRSTGAGKIAAE